MSYRKLLAVAAIALVSIGSVARADESNAFQGATITLSWGSGNSWTLPIPGSTDGSPEYSVPDGSQSTSGWTLTWSNVYFNADPVVAGVFAVTNNTGVTQTYSLNVLMPTAFATGGSTTISGGSAISVVDANASGGMTMSATSGSSIYTAKVNGVGVRTLFDDPYTLSNPPPFATSDNLNYGPEAGPNVAFLNNIGIDHSFTLSPGDQATVNSVFVIVPEPTTMSLLVLGSVFVLRRKTR
ncbi:MAG: PEP-CTERM sorting domain-containing protein [Phycisphaerae bacterium]|nr:PEP-CTERM sorting domain-containing protein [Phycisphaerae bacterium]